MSFQMAMMGASMAMSAVSAVQGMSATKAAGEQAAAAAQMRAAGGRAAAAATGLEMGETKLQVQQQEQARRREIAKLWQANAIDLVARGGIATGDDSTSVLQAENRKLGEEDIANIRLMGESRLAKLSFRQTQQTLGAMVSDQEAINAGEMTSRLIGQQITGTLGKLLGMGASFGGGGGGAPDTNAVMRDAIPRDKWGDYGVS